MKKVLSFKKKKKKKKKIIIYLFTYHQNLKILKNWKIEIKMNKNKTKREKKKFLCLLKVVTLAYKFCTLNVATIMGQE